MRKVKIQGLKKVGEGVDFKSISFKMGLASSDSSEVTCIWNFLAGTVDADGISKEDNKGAIEV